MPDAGAALEAIRPSDTPGPSGDEISPPHKWRRRRSDAQAAFFAPQETSPREPYRARCHPVRLVHLEPGWKRCVQGWQQLQVASLRAGLLLPLEGQRRHVPDRAPLADALRHLP